MFTLQSACKMPSMNKIEHSALSLSTQHSLGAESQEDQSELSQQNDEINQTMMAAEEGEFQTTAGEIMDCDALQDLPNNLPVIV